MGPFLTSTAINIAAAVLEIAWVMPLLLAAELLFPTGRISTLSRLRGTTFLLIYVVIAAAITAAAQEALTLAHIRPLFALQLPARMSSTARIAAGAAAAFLLMFATDFFTYWTHRAQHTWPWLWRLHSVHHSITELSAVNGFTHWAEQLMRFPAVTIPMALLIPADLHPLPFVLGFGYFSGYFDHAATRLHFGPLRRVLCDNRMHRIHHSLQPEHLNRNFGVFTTVWDQMFGTAHFPAADEWPETGVRDMPEPLTIGAFLLWPLRRRVANLLTIPAE